uniref:Uncharacterized protein n=1 Tax=Knipowitschia caucasica TaxID=637954 RepID=A0AAV2MJA0_KNICA
MRISSVVALLLHALVMSRSVSGAAVDRYEGDRLSNTAVINLLASTQDKRTEQSLSVATTTMDYTQEDEDYKEEQEYYDEEYEDGLSGDYEMPRVSMSSKPNDPSSILEAEKAEGTRRRGNGRKKGKGKGRKRNPCLKKYVDYCIHGTCRYMRAIRAPACICHQWYSGDSSVVICLSHDYWAFINAKVS